MATPVTPAAPAAPSAPAPSPSPSPSPAPAPAAPNPKPAPAAPISVPATPEAQAPAPVPATPEAPAPAPAEVAPKGEPNQNDYSNDAEGLEQFLNDREQWKLEHPEPEKPADAVPPADGQQQAGEEKKPDAAKPADAAMPTPQSLDEWTSKDPAFKAALEANPELKGELFAQARFNERAKPVLEIVSTPEDATFAVENANAFVDLRTGLMLSVEDPSRLPATFDKLQDLFRVKDAAGNYVKDAAGNVQMAEDYSLLQNQFVSDGFQSKITPLKAKVEELKTRLQNGVYPSPAAKAADEHAFEDSEYAVAALEYAQNLLSPGEAGTQLPELPDDATPAQRELQESLKKQVEELNQSKQTNSREQRTAKRKEYSQQLSRSWGGGVGKMLDEAIKQEEQAGGFIPKFVLEEKWIDPQTNKETNVKSLGVRVLQEFNAKVMALPSVKTKMAELEMMPPGPEAIAAANAYYTDLRTKYLPGIIKAQINRIQQGILEGQDQRQQQRQQQQQVAGVEPQSGATPAPQSMSSAQLSAKAKENAAKLPGYADMTGEEQLEVELQERYKLRGLTR